MSRTPETPAGKRRRAERRGRRAETLAAWWLRAKGYRILARRFRVAQGEIDLVARRGRILAFVEVKARAADGAEDGAISARQRQRIARAALAFIQQRPAFAAYDLRFDAVFIAPGRGPRHIPDAWRPDF